MADAFKYIVSHWYVALAFVVLIVLTIFVWIKAILSSKKRNDERERIIADIEKEKELRHEFRHVDEVTFNRDKDNYRLITGMCAHIQQKIEKKEDMNKAFCELSEAGRFIYALGYVFEDGDRKLSEFFRSNGEPLLSAAKDAVDMIIGGTIAEIFDREFIMLDENDETTSVDNDALAKMDEAFSVLMDKDGEKIYADIAEYIRGNKDEFIEFE